MTDSKPQDADEKSQSLEVCVRVEEQPQSSIVASSARPLARAAVETKTIGAAAPRSGGATAVYEERRTRFSPVLVSFIVFVLLPAIAGVLYFAVFASDQYAVEMRFAVRSVEAEAESSATDAKANGTGNFAFTPATQNAFIVTSYIKSRAAVDDINARLDLREMFRRPEADFWARLKRDAVVDELTEYWISIITTYVDTLSGIVTVKFRTFRREDALAVGNAIVEASETLVNRISERARRDATMMAEKEVRKAFKGVQSALDALRDFRDLTGALSPGDAAVGIVKLLAPLLAEKSRLDSELFVASRQLSADAPTVRTLKIRLEAVETQIAEQKAQLTGSGNGGKTIASTLGKFEELEIQRLLAERLYTLAQAELDRAQARANRQGVYLTVFVPPTLPEESRYPRRIAFPVLAFMGLLVIWSIGVLIVASVNDHRL